MANQQNKRVVAQTIPIAPTNPLPALVLPVAPTSIPVVTTPSAPTPPMGDNRLQKGVVKEFRKRKPPKFDEEGRPKDVEE